MASIEQRGDSWSTYWRFGGRNGKKQRVTVGSEKLATRAKEIAEAHRHLITRAEVETILGIAVGENGNARRSTLPTVREWAATWLETRTRISPDTRWRYGRQLDLVILPAIGDLHLDEVSGATIVAVLKQVRSGAAWNTDDKRWEDGDARGEATATRYFAVLSSMFKYAVKEGQIRDNPCERTDFVRDLIAHDDASDEGDEHCYLTRAEYHLIRQHMAARGKPVIDLLAGTGMRWSEATAVPVGAIQPKTRRTKPGLRCHRAWKRDEQRRWYLGATKGRTCRTVTVGATLADIIDALATSDDGKRRKDDALLLTAPNGGRLEYSNFRYRLWEPAIDAAMRCTDHPPTEAADGGPPKNERDRWRRGAVSTCDCDGRLRQRPSLHDLRHTHTAWLIAAGRPIAAISRRLGHRSTDVTEQIYAGILPELHEAMADTLDELLSGDAVTDGEAAG